MPVLLASIHKSVFEKEDVSAVFELLKSHVETGGIPKEAEEASWWRDAHASRGGFTDDAGVHALAGYASICRYLAAQANSLAQELDDEIVNTLAGHINWPVNAVRMTLRAIAWRKVHPPSFEMEHDFPAAINEEKKEGKTGRMLRLSMRVMKPGQGLLMPDPKAAFMKLGEEFRGSLKNAAKACGMQAWWPGNPLPDDVENDLPDIFWGLYKPNGRAWVYASDLDTPRNFLDLDGPSLGGAFYTAMQALLLDARNGSSPAITQKQPDMITNA